MKIAVSAQSKEVEAFIDPRFGRCAQFLIFDLDLENEDFTALKPVVLDNAAINATGGAGIQAAQMIIDEGIEIVITGNLGPNASRVLSTGNIVSYSAEGSVIEALKSLKDKKLPKIEGHSVPGHFGTGRGMGRGRNR
ncbi:MAG: NifB/NifX family molybdenum-iron cluster-binding protein [Candidatus Hodarchaeales archaeon]